MKRNLFYGVCYLTFLFLLHSCATYGPAPIGGDKDVTPPKFLNSIPKNYSANFTAKQVRLNFDEYVQLKEAGKIFISPPLKGISYSSNLKQIRIDIVDTLNPDVTYTVNFGRSLTDINESNPLAGFQYVFSQNVAIDTDYIFGTILDAFTLMPVIDASILLFKEKKDSLYLVKDPEYIGVTDSNGHFFVNHLKNGCYYVYAIKEKSKNYAIEANEEQIAYSNVCVPTRSEVVAVDTATIATADTAVTAADTAVATATDTATIATADTATFDINDLVFLLYQDKEPKQFLKEGSFSRRGIAGLKFYYPITDSLSVYFSDTVPAITVLSEDKMSATVYLTEMNLAEATAVVKNGIYTDTLEFLLTENQLKLVDTTPFKYSVSSNKDKLFSSDSIILNFTLPLFNYLGSTHLPFTAIGEEDTIYGEVVWQKISPTAVKIAYPWQSGYSYRIMVPYCTFSDFFDKTIDTSYLTLRGAPLDEYGEFGIQLSGLQGTNYFLQILNNKNVPIKQIPVGGDGIYDIKLIPPGEYTIWLYEDKNKDGIWNVGDFYSHLQPERRQKYSKTIKIEADWRIEEKWDIKNE
ncbi:MAG: Ig-like domain-containing protein [Bacteroidales bacterium]|jgi:hypothetical protein|nr:Ig-like domain-containing protein [Bacteroidales bacterium]